MELIDRYLQAVKFWLPKQQKQDIIAELWEDLQSEVEGRESELGRSLHEDEVAALLKRRGRPVLVANRYLPQQYLIGPVLFPIYLFVLKVTALCYLVPWVFVWLGMMLYSPAYRAAQGAGSWLSALGSLWGSFWLTATVTVGAVTIAFAILERTQVQLQFLEKWDPRKLPPVRDPNQIPRSGSIIELVVSLFVIGWLIPNMRSPLVWQFPEIRVVLTSAWSYFYWGTLAVMLTNASLAATNLMRPYATRVRTSLRLLSDLAGSVMFCWLLKANIIAAITVANVTAAKSLEVTNALNWWMPKLLPVGIIIGIVTVGIDIYRIIRVKPAAIHAAHQATIVATVLLIALGAGLRVMPEKSANTAPRVTMATMHSINR